MTAFFVLATTLLIVDMVRRIRRVRYRAQVEEERMAALAAGEQDMLDVPVTGDAGAPSAGAESAGAQSPGTQSAGAQGRAQSAGAEFRTESNGDEGRGRS